MAVVFLHAHPDDEAIFTGGTMARLAAAGERVVLVVATSGDQGAGPVPERVAHEREQETLRASELLGVARVEFLRYGDSGMDGEPGPGSLGAQRPLDVGARVAAVLAGEDVRALVIYDEGGVYPHPDHLQVHQAGVLAATATGVPTVYQATVDREYLHFVGTHLVELAVLDRFEMHEVGVPSVLISTQVDVRSQLATKRAAIAAHASQVPELHLDELGDAGLEAVYGYEWYIRDGPPGPIEALDRT